MTESDRENVREKAKVAAVSSVGAGVGGAGGATVGVLELAARGVATGLSASLAIGFGAVAGAGIAYGVYRFFARRKGPAPARPAPETSAQVSIDNPQRQADGNAGQRG